MSIATDGFGTIVAGLETGGGGGSVIPDGGSVTGTYEGNLVCEGAVTLTGNLTVNGSMIVLGNFTNDGGYEVTIRGDLHAQGIYFDKADTSTPQQNFTVDGDLIFTYMEFRQCGGVAAQLRVGGDLIGSAGFAGTPLYGNGVTSGTNGLNIVVYGDMTVAYIDLNGAEGTTSNGGTGGTVYVYGSLTTESYLTAAGGNATDFDAGNGGDLYVRGDANCGYNSIDMHGGDATNGNAGNGGEVDIAGNMQVNELELYGGDCTSDNENHRSGSGGTVEVDGDLNTNDFLSVRGGNRFGNLLAGSGQEPPNGGTVTVYGDFNIDGDFSGDGGDVNTSGFAPHNAGNGANVYIYGSLNCSDDFRAYGGYADQGNGGSGGSVRVEGVCYVDDELEFYGGTAQNGNGGQGGNINIYGAAFLGYVSISGGYATNGNGGSGGYFDCRGPVSLTDTFYANGGECNSANEAFFAGNGGSFYCDGLTAQGNDLDLQGGDRYGATTVSATGNSSASGGSFSSDGDATVGDIDLRGGSIYTDYPNAPGGNGGTIYAYGFLHADYLSLQGGRAVGNAGGQGGTIYAYGFSTLEYLTTTGGNADDSVLGGDAGVNGAAGSAYFYRGVTARELLMVDGSGPGGAPGNNVFLGLGGGCHFNTVNMTDRPECWIYTVSDIPTTLRLLVMPTKQTLNNNAGVATGNISAILDTSLFMSGSGSTWYAVAGVAV